MIRRPELAAALAIVKADQRQRRAESKAERLARAREHLKALAEGQRKPRERDNGFLAYLRRQPCEALHMGLGECRGHIDAAHIRFNDGPDRQNPGGGRKNHDRHCNPLCRAHHDIQGGMSERGFWMRLGKDAYATAAGHYARYKGIDNA